MRFIHLPFKLRVRRSTVVLSLLFVVLVGLNVWIRPSKSRQVFVPYIPAPTTTAAPARTVPSRPATTAPRPVTTPPPTLIVPSAPTSTVAGVTTTVAGTTTTSSVSPSGPTTTTGSSASTSPLPSG